MGEIYNKKTKQLVNPIDWCGVDRCMLGAYFIGVWYFLQAGFGFYIESDPTLIPFLHSNAHHKLNLYLLSCGFLWAGLFLLSLVLRRKQDENKALEIATVLLPGPLVMVVALSHGLLTSSVLPGLVAVSMLGFFLFETRLMIFAVLFNVVLVILLSGLSYLGYISNTQLYSEIKPGTGSNVWMIGQFIITLYPLFCGIIMTMFFLKGLREKESQIRELSRKDGLTGIWNRRYLMEIFDRELVLSKRNETPISFVMIDLDYFKKLNDEYGHKMGDRALEIAAKVLQNAIRTTDYIGRYGGEEFAAILPDCSVRSAREVAERCRQAVEATAVEYNGMRVNLTASVGVTTVVDTGDVHSDTIIDRADKALYESKGAGRNRVSFFAEPVYMNLVRG